MPRRKIKKDENNKDGKMGDFGSAIAQICEEKGISKDKVIETVEAALAAAYKKDYGKRGQNIRAEFDEISGEANFCLVKEVVDETMREFPVEEEMEEGEDKKEEKNKAGKISEHESASASAKTLVSNPAFTESSASEEEKLPRFNPERDLTLEEAKKIKKKCYGR